MRVSKGVFIVYFALALLLPFFGTLGSAAGPNPCINAAPSCGANQLCKVTGIGSSAADRTCAVDCGHGGTCLNGGNCTANVCTCHRTHMGNFCEFRNRCTTSRSAYTCNNSGTCSYIGFYYGAYEYSCTGCSVNFGPQCSQPTATQVIVTEWWDRYVRAVVVGGSVINTGASLCGVGNALSPSCTGLTVTGVAWDGAVYMDVGASAPGLNFDAWRLKDFGASFTIISMQATSLFSDASFIDLDASVAPVVGPAIHTISFGVNQYLTGTLSLTGMTATTGIFFKNTGMGSLTISGTTNMGTLETYDSPNLALAFKMSDTLKLATMKSYNMASSAYKLSDAEMLGGAGTFTLLTLMQAYQTNIQGSLPASLSTKLPAMVDLQLQNTGISGTIPTSMFMATLKILNLSNNGAALNGPIPTQIGASTVLTYLNLASNDLSGSVPSELSKATTLSFMYLNDNSLSGALPTTVWVASLLSVDLHDNYFTGGLPTQIGAMTKLTYMDLHNSQVVGTIPTQIGLLVAMDYLDISYNYFPGSIPTQLKNVGLLTLLAHQSGLSGTFPTELFATVSLNILLVEITLAVPIPF